MPTFIHGKNSRVIVGSDDLSSSFRDFTVGTQVDMADTTAFGNNTKVYTPGLGDAEISMSGMFSGGTGEVDDLLGTYVASSDTVPVIVAPEGYGIGNRGFGIGANESSYEITSSIGDIVSVSATFQSQLDSGGRSGSMLTDGVALPFAASTNYASVDDGAATTNGGYAILAVTANSLDATATIHIEDSTNDSTFADLVTFATVAAGTQTAEFAVITGNIDRYARLNVATAATTGSITAHVLLVRA